MWLEGYWNPSGLKEELPGASDLVRPMLAVLVREGLIEDLGMGTYDYEPTFGLTNYGRQFLQFLPAEDVPELGRAHLIGIRKATTELVIRNVGLGPAHAVQVVGPLRSDGQSWSMNGTIKPFDLPAGDERMIPIRPPNALDLLQITLRWEDEAGEHQAQLTEPRPVDDPN